MDGIVGMIKLYVRPDGIPGWFHCNGQALSKADYPELFAVIGTRYGGDETTFLLPAIQQQGMGFPLICARPNGEGEFQGHISQVVLYTGTNTPTGLHECDGTMVAPAQYPTLAKLIGNRYGGDGVHQIALPTMPPQGGIRYLICLEGITPEMQAAGDDD